RPPGAGAGRWLAAPPARRAGPFHERRPRLAPRVVERRRRAPEPDVCGAPGPGLGVALLAPEGRRLARAWRGPLRRRLRGYAAVDGGLSRVAGQDAARSGAGRPAPPAVAGPAAASRR